MNETDEELNLNDALVQAVEYIGDKKNNFLFEFLRMYQYADEPKFMQYYAQLECDRKEARGKRTIAGGFSFFSQEIAALKCLCEALERYSQKTYDPKLIKYCSVKELGGKAIDIRKIAAFSEKQRQTSSELQLKPNGRFGWVKGKSLVSMKDVYIPAQIVYFTYRRQKSEGFIRHPISTGAATGTSYSGAIYRGLCEVIERDAFMITYLQSLPRDRIALNKSKNADILHILRIAKNYNLEIYCYDISTDIGVSVFLAIVHDKTGIAAAISTGLKCSLNPTDAVIGSIHEAFHTRSWLRREKNKFKGKQNDLLIPVDLATRGILWSIPESTVNLDFLLKTKNSGKNIDAYKNQATDSTYKNMNKVVSILKTSGYESFYYDITPDLPHIKKSKFKSVMTIVPELQPMYLDERYKFLGGTRLYSVPEKLGYTKIAKKEENLNKFPHPFL